jgi:crotonobetainyl-CoA:carnitine CoA-transferase CaiB-like acyl-CoA transferase
MSSIDIDFLPLSGVRVVDMCDGRGEMCGRYLADLGADVVLVEPPDGMQSRRRQPLHDGHSLRFAVRNANKRSVALPSDPDAGRARLLQLLDAADIFIESMRPGDAEVCGLSAAQLHARNPRLVVLSITDFGLTGPYRDFRANNAVHMALGGVLARSGIKGERPLLPPGELAYETTAVQAAWVALLAYWRALQGGRGDHLDFSVYEATAQIIDPGMGVTGSAAAGRSALEMAPRGRPPVGQGYPIFTCADGCVRICILNPRQWQGMCTWLGDDHPFTDPSFGSIGRRMQSIREINALIAALFASQKCADLVAEGQRRGVPIAAVASPGQALRDPHFLARGTFVPLSVGAATGSVPRGYVEVDGNAAGIRRAAPVPGADNDAVFAQWSQARDQSMGIVEAAAATRPLAGLRVLDLGVIVAGAELGRLLSDQGAEVIKIESSAFPDGLRQGMRNEAMTISFAQGSRGKKSFGLNLRSARGLEIFKRLVAISDIVISNFKPGTMASLGLGYDVLKAINPGIICAESSALGSSGPRSRSMGYGPLVRATAGLTWLWRYPSSADSFSDSTTIIPDHFAARVSATAIAALLIRRRKTGLGGRVDVSQAETILTAFSAEFLRESLQPGSVVALGNRNEFDAPNNVFACAGDDEWCVVAVDGDRAWKNLCAAIEREDLASDGRFHTAAGRVAHCGELEAVVQAWTARHTPEDVMQILQAAGVPAARMQRLDEFTSNPHFNARRFFRTFTQPGLLAPMFTENGPVSVSSLPEPELRPAPFLAQHTEEIAANLLGLSAAEIADLIGAGDLEIMPAGQRAALLAQ